MLYNILRSLILFILLSTVISLGEAHGKGPVNLESYAMRKLICNRTPWYGKCKGHRKLWYYDKHKAKCLTFFYSNCGGNENRFYTLQDCKNFCESVDIKYEKDFSD